MTGLEKVTGKILADAEADARAILEKANADCHALVAAKEAETEAAVDRLREQADRECQSLIIRAKSSAAMARRNVVLGARAAILDEAYATAEKNIRALPAEQYLDLLFKMLRGALKRQLEGEAESLKLYGEDVTPDAYEVILNAHDRAAYGEGLMASFAQSMGQKLGGAVMAKLVLSPETAAISGGLILRCGPVESNCSLEMLFAENRRATEAQVSRILFGENA